MLSELANAAVKIAVNGACEWFEAHGTSYVSLDAFANCIKASVKLHLPAALAEAKDALDANMPKGAEQIFAACMVMAGVDAAKESAACPTSK